MKTKKFRKFLSMLMALVLVVGLVIPSMTETAFADGATVTFVDINSDGTLDKDEVNAKMVSAGVSSSTPFTPVFPSVTTIGAEAFYNCTGLNGQLSLPSSLTTIGPDAFRGCAGLSAGLVLPSNVKTIGDRAFDNCTGISGVLILPEGLTSIGAFAFHGCSQLSGDLTIPDSVTTMGEHAFEGCRSFNGSLQLSSELTVIDNLTFNGCELLSGTLDIPQNVTSIGEYAFSGCEKFSALTLPYGLNAIRDGAFIECNGLSGALDIPDTVTSIGASAFSGGNSTNGFTGTVNIPNGVTTIPDQAFNYCSNISSVTLPSTITSLGPGAFYACSELSSVRFLGSAAPSAESNTFAYVKYGAVIHVLPTATGFDSGTWYGLTVAKDLDNTAPILSAASVSRTSDTEATIGFTTDEAGTAYYVVKDKDAPSPSKEIVAAGTSLGSVSGAVTNKSVTLTSGTKEIYVVVKDASGNISNPLKIQADEISPAEALANTLSGLGFTTAVSSSAITVTGTKSATAGMTLTIPSGVTVIWKASLTGAVDGTMSSLIFLNGDGTFELASGELTNTGTGMALSSIKGSIVISGGTASSSNEVATVRTYYTPSAPTLTMTGGTVTSTSDEESSSAISAGGNTVITGGTVAAQSGKQVLLNNAVVVYRSGLLSKISSGSLSASIAVDQSRTYACPGETAGLTATGYSALAGHVTAKWAVLYSGEGTGVWVDYTYSGTGSGTWRVSYPDVKVVAYKQSLSYDANGGDNTVTARSTVYSGQTCTVSTNFFTRSGFNFTGWNTKADGTGSPYAAGGTLIGAADNDDIVLYAQWSEAGSSSGGKGSGSTPSVTAPPASISGSTATATVKPTIGTDGKAAAVVTADQIGSALEKAQEASKSGDPIEVKIKVEGTSGVNSVAATIPSDSIKKLASGAISGLTVSSGLGDLTFGEDALKTISGAASGDVKVTASKVEASSLSEDARKVVGSHPVYEFSVTSGGKTISEFGGTVTASLPYKPAAGEDPKAIVIYYIAADGKLTMVPDAHYDAATGMVVFTTTHFSTYAVGYNKVSFRDVADTAWYSEAVNYLAARGITSGTSTTTFGSSAVLTRGQFITMLLKAYGIAPDTNSGDNFSDAGNTYYTGYLAAAKKLGVSDGIGGNLFAPDKAVTRQEMFTMLYNALKAIDKQPEGTSGKALSDFSDASAVASWASDAMNELAKAGTISGSGGKLSPTKTTTRAEMAQVLYNLLGK